SAWSGLTRAAIFIAATIPTACGTRLVGACGQRTRTKSPANALRGESEFPKKSGVSRIASNRVKWRIDPNIQNARIILLIAAAEALERAIRIITFAVDRSDVMYWNRLVSAPFFHNSCKPERGLSIILPRKKAATRRSDDSRLRSVGARANTGVEIRRPIT